MKFKSLKTKFFQTPAYKRPKALKTWQWFYQSRVVFSPTSNSIANYFICKGLPFDENSSEQKFPKVSSFIYIIHLRRNVSSRSDGGNSSLIPSLCRSREWEMLRFETELEITPQLWPRFGASQHKIPSWCICALCGVHFDALPSLKA